MNIVDGSQQDYVHSDSDYGDEEKDEYDQSCEANSRQYPPPDPREQVERSSTVHQTTHRFQKRKK